MTAATIAAIVARSAAEWRGEQIRWDRARAAAAHPVIDRILEEAKAPHPMLATMAARYERMAAIMADPVPVWQRERATALRMARICKALGKTGGVRRCLRTAAEKRQDIAEWRARG